MEPFRPYVWLRKQGSQFNEFFTISIPANFRISGGLQTPIDNTSTRTRTYKFTIEAHAGSAPSTVDNNTGNHSQPTNISKIEFQVVDVTIPTNPVKKGVTDTEYQDADDLG